MQPRYDNSFPPLVSLGASRGPLPSYNNICLVKRSRALRGRNPTRNNQVKVRQGRVGPLVGLSRWRPFSCPLDTLPCLRKSDAAKRHALLLVSPGRSRLRGLLLSWPAANDVRLVVLHHLFTDRRQPPHHGHAADLRPTPPLDFSIPRLH